MDRWQQIAEARTNGYETTIRELEVLAESARIVMDAIGGYLDAARITARIDPDTGELGGSDFPDMVRAATSNHARATSRFQVYAAALQAAKALRPE